MRVLVTWASKRGGTEGIARTIGEVLTKRGYEVVMSSVQRAPAPDTFDAVVLGGALYSHCWPESARRFVNRYLVPLRKRPVWLFSSGPLNDSADDDDIPATAHVAVLAERIGAQGHVTFGGAFAPDMREQLAREIEEKLAGDFRNGTRVRSWADELARAIPGAKPGTSIDHRAAAFSRLFWYALLGWALCTAALLIHARMRGLAAAQLGQIFIAPPCFLLLAVGYFRAWGARDPLHVAVGWTVIVVLMDVSAIVSGAQAPILKSFGDVWPPLSLVFLVTWLTGLVVERLPSTASSENARQALGEHRVQSSRSHERGGSRSG